MERIRNSLPTAKQVLVTIIVCLAIGVLAQGFTPKALFALVFGVFFLFLVTWRNYDPEAWEAYHNPEQHQLRTERDLLYLRLKAMTLAIERDGDVRRGQAEAVDARELLDTIKNQHKPKIESK